MVIFKYRVTLGEPFKGPKDITFGNQVGDFVVWYNPDHALDRVYIIVMTGQEIVSKSATVLKQTIQMHGFVFHLIDITL